MTRTAKGASHILTRLHKNREDLRALARASAEGRKAVELDQTRVGRLSRMDAMQSQAMAQETARRRDLELKRIDAALERLETGEYGYCLKCGDEIAHRRLEHDPAAAFCVNCAEPGRTN